MGHDPAPGTSLSGSFRKEAVIELLPPTTNLLRSHKVSHRHGSARKHCIICFKVEPNFKHIISIPKPKYLVHISYLYLVFFIQNGISHYQLIPIHMTSSRGSQHLPSTPLHDLLVHRLHHSLHSNAYAGSTPANHEREFASRLRQPLAQQADFFLPVNSSPKSFLRLFLSVHISELPSEE